ncbi:MAG: MlaD family protein [Planctomycetes bacterium]|nr:MlaD family protein [Planctomycetota bacterium]
MSTRMNPGRQLILGIFIVSALGLLGYYTLFLKEFSLFSEQAQISVTFDEARGLRAGDAVLVAGVRWGRVAEVEYDSTAELDRRITVVATLTNPVEFREGGSFQIKDSTLLGGRVLSIDPGPPGATVLPMDHPYRGAVVTSPLDAMGELISENSEAFSLTLNSLSEIVGDANEGRGVIGSLLKDDDLATDLKDTVDHVESITRTIRAGEGTLGRLLVADELYQSISRSATDLEVSLANVRKTTDGVEAGEGALGALLKDQELEEQLRSIVASVNKVTGELEAGRGTLGKLITNEEVFDNVRKISEDLAAVTEKVRSGEGTLGRIVMKEDLFVEVEQAIGLITRTLEEYREAAPVTTMTSVLFSAF